MITLILNTVGWTAFFSATLIWLWGKVKQRGDAQGEGMSQDLSETIVVSLVCFSLGIFTASLVVTAVVVYTGDGY